MFRIGVIGLGSRISTMLDRFLPFEVPFRVAAVADPRGAEIKAKGAPWLDEKTQYFADGEAMVEKADELDGIMVGTRCFLHADNAITAAKRNVPLFVEKPVAISFPQVQRLAETFKDYKPQVVVSFPLRVGRMCRDVRKLIEEDTIGKVDCVTAFNDVPYGRGYYSGYCRDLAQSGGLWLQKATHDLDYLNYLVGQRPTGVFAMHSRRTYGGDKPNDLRCSKCPEAQTCPESTFNLWYQALRVPRPVSAGDKCVFSKEASNIHDIGHCLVEYADGLQINYCQNFVARHKAARRGARIQGYKGSIEFDWYQNRIQVFSHRSPTAQTIEYPYFEHHWGGDRELNFDWLNALTGRAPSRCPMDTGIISALMCLWARQSANTRQYCDITMPSEREAERLAAVPITMG